MATGTRYSFGGLTVGSEQIELPNSPWYSSSNDLKVYDGTSDINFTDTPSDIRKHLNWIKVIDGNKTIYISDRVLLVGISWEMLNNMGYVYGKEITINGSIYKCRLLTGGTGPRDSSSAHSGGTPTNNEWDRYIVNEANLSGLRTPSSTDLDGSLENTDLHGSNNWLWHWYSVFTLCQEDCSGTEARFPRGYYSPKSYDNTTKYNTSNVNIGWRPVLEVIAYKPYVEVYSNYGEPSSNSSFSMRISVKSLNLNDKVTIYASMDGYFEKKAMTSYSGSEDSGINLTSRPLILNFKNNVLHHGNKPITDTLEHGREYTIIMWGENKYGLRSDISEVKFTLTVKYPSIDMDDYSDMYAVDLINELRFQTNRFRKFNGLKEIDWTVSELIPGVTPIRAVDWNEIKMAILEVYTKLGINFTDSTLERKLNDIILANNKRYQVNDLPLRINEIIKALRNE